MYFTAGLVRYLYVSARTWTLNSYENTLVCVYYDRMQWRKSFRVKTDRIDLSTRYTTDGNGDDAVQFIQRFYGDGARTSRATAERIQLNLNTEQSGISPLPFHTLYLFLCV